jgi:hypothetical protein
MKHTSRPSVGVLVVAGALVVPPLFLTGQTWEIIPLAAIVALTTLFWRPVQTWSKQLAKETPPSENARLRELVAALQVEVHVLALEQRQLRERMDRQDHPAQHERLSGGAEAAPRVQRLVARGMSKPRPAKPVR